MEMKPIIIWITIIIGGSMTLGVILDSIPKIINKLTKPAIYMMFIVSLFRNISFMKEIAPQIKALAIGANVQGVIHTIVFYVHHYFVIAWNLLIKTLENI